MKTAAEIGYQKQIDVMHKGVVKAITEVQEEQKASFTPGTWHIAESSRKYNGKLMILANVPDDNPVHVCEVTTNTRGSKINIQPHQDANAILIAAAPDLLQMVIELLDCMGNCDSEIENDARALVAKETRVSA